MLLVAVRRGDHSYNSIYCEHHEDLMCEVGDGTFDGYQLKTRRPELGAWTMTDDALVDAIARFVDLVDEFTDQVRKLFFVSNAEFDHPSAAIQDQVKVGKSPILFINHIKTCASHSAIQEPYRNAFRKLSARIACSDITLFQTLKRVDLISGPSRREMDATLAHEHIGGLSECKALTPPQLDALRDSLVAMVHRAASLQVTDPHRHVRGFFSATPNPEIEAKRIVCSMVEFKTSEPHAKFRFVGEPKLELGKARDHTVLEKKLKRGGLEDDVVAYMKSRDLSAEYCLLETQARDPATFGTLLKQVEESVHGECVEAFIEARITPEPFGEAMFRDLSARLRRLETDRKLLLGGQPYETLMGVAAMLTNECRVWWSKRFSIEDVL